MITQAPYGENEFLKDRYVVQEYLGQGSFSRVYRVLDVAANQVVVLKILKDGSKEDLQREYHTLKGLNHPNIARVYDVDTIDFMWCLKMDYIDGPTLERLIRDKLISLSKARTIINDLLAAAEYMQSKGVVHRDLKPSNVVISQRGAVIVDFNVSKRVESLRNTKVGTALYMPPEVHRGAGWPPTGDLYSIGIILYEMVTGGGNPFQRGIPSLDEIPRDPRELNPTLSASLANAIGLAIAQDPAERYPTAEAMRAALDAADWEPVRRGLPVVPIDLASVNIPKEEWDKPNYNPYLTRLLTLYSQSQLSNAGTRGLDAFARATYVPTRLDTVLLPDILGGAYQLVIITGNAGDGKTAFLQKLEEIVQSDPEGGHFQALPSGNGARFSYGARQFVTNYDGSQDESNTTNDAVLEAFFHPFAGPGPLRMADRIYLIAINEGRLIDFLQGHRNDFPYLYDQVTRFFAQRAFPDPGLLIINLNLRAIVAQDETGWSLFDGLVARLIHPALWEPCQACDIRDRCYAKFNADSLNDAQYGFMVRERLKALFQAAHFRRRLHLTMRDVRSALAYTLFGADTCDGIHALLQDVEARPEYLARFYYNAPYDFEQPARTSQDRLVVKLSEIDPGQTANPKLDADLVLTPPEALDLLPPFDTRSAVDRDLLAESFAALQATHADTSTAARERWHLYLAMLRRKAYAERIGDEWRQMLPYRRFLAGGAGIAFLDLMSAPDPEHLAQVRDDLVYAISMSERIYQPELGAAYLCLRTSQEPRASITSFRRFSKERFRCRVPDIGDLHRHLEYIPPVLLLEYDPEESSRIVMEIDLDLYEMLYRLRHGYTPSLNELRGPYINLLIFKRQLARTDYDEVVLTEDGSRFYHIRKQGIGKLEMVMSQGGP